MSDDLHALYAKLQPGQSVWVQIGLHAQQPRLGFITAVGWDSVDVIYFPPEPYPPVVRLSGVWLLSDPRIAQSDRLGLRLGDRGFCKPTAEWLQPLNVIQRLEMLEKAVHRLQRQEKQDA